MLLLFLANASVAQAEGLSASALLCKELAQPGKVAGAAYVPGVDVYGRKVASADVGTDNQVMPLQVLRIPIDVDLAQRFHLALPSGVELKPTLGMMNISQDGTVDFNGQDITQQAGAFCSGVVTHRNVPAQARTSGQSLNGQAGADRIISNSDTGVRGADVIHGQAN